MANALHVKEKSAWKTVNIPQDLLNTEQFDGLVDIQELTDYDLVPFQFDSDDEDNVQKSKKSKRRKRKRGDDSHEIALQETIAEAENDNVDELPQKFAKKRKKEKKSITMEMGDKATESHVLNSDESKSTNSSKKLSKSAKKRNRQKKKKLLKSTTTGTVVGEFIKHDTVLMVDDSETSEVSGNEPSDLKKVKTQKKKKLSDTDNSDSMNNNQIVTDDEETLVVSEISFDSPNGRSSEKISPVKKKKQTEKKKKKKLKSCNSLGNEDIKGSLNPNTDAAEGTTNIGEINGSTVVEGKLKPDMSQWRNLFVPDVLLKALQDQGFDTPSTIQSMALPSAIRDRKDILGAAETGSGKTLAFGIPVLTRILNARKHGAAHEEDESSEEEMDIDGSDDVRQKDLAKKSHKKRRKGSPSALILEPTRELAVQVKKHLTALAKHTDIQFVTVVGGMSVEKQRRILAKKPHVIIATPGRLWQLIEEGNDYLCQVDKVQCLVVDEADRMVEKGHYEELTKLLEMINKSVRRVKNRQTFVMSATLTMDVSAPKRLMAKPKMKVKEEDKLKTLTDKICTGIKPKVIDLTPKDKVAQTLTELRVNCKADEKDFYLYYFLCQHPGRTLVFANSKDCLRRLVSVLTLLQCSPLPLHADMHQRQRLKNLDKFAENSRGLLVASDVAARGLDIPKVDHVIHYQVPRTMENYVHRSGRTARASNLGLSVMLVGPEDAKDYRKIVYGVRNGEELSLLPVELDMMPAVKQRVGLARDVDVQEYRIKKKRIRNNFFTKAAEEMDMIIDDKNLLHDMGDPADQAQDKHRLKQLKSQLASMLKGSLAPLRMTKYPTKSGQLATKKFINLYAQKE